MVSTSLILGGMGWYPPLLFWVGWDEICLSYSGWDGMRSASLILGGMASTSLILGGMGWYPPLLFWVGWDEICLSYSGWDGMASTSLILGGMGWNGIRTDIMNGFKFFLNDGGGRAGFGGAGFGGEGGWIMKFFSFIFLLVIIKVTKIADALESLEQLLDVSYHTHEVHVPGTSTVSAKLQLPIENLIHYLKDRHGLEQEAWPVLRQFRHGQSNPTYYLAYGGQEMVLRKKPVSENGRKRERR